LTFLFVVLAVLLAGSAFAQYQTGNIYGKVMAKDGSILPGVTVTLTGVGAPQSAVSGPNGDFHFVNLSPGTYTLKADLSGYGVATRSGIGVRVGQAADITITMNPSVAESITVTAEAPLIDTRKSGAATNVAKVELEQIPQSRDPWSVMQTTPSIQVDRINVGGTQSGQQSVYYAKGALGRDNSWNMDGVNITDMGATGSSPVYFDFDTFEELQITTSASDPRISTPGVQLNMVTKRGTNDFKGSGRYLYTPGSMSPDATVPTEADPYLAATNHVNFVRDYGLELGGPLWKDRAWFWIARGDQKISAFQSQGKNSDGSLQFLIPDNTILRNKNLKLNGQIVSSNSAVAYYTFGDKFRNARDLSPTRPFETSYKQTGPTKIYKLEDTQIIGSSLYLTGMWSKVDGGFGLFANGGQGESAPSRWVDNAGVNHDNYYTYVTERPQKQYRIDGSKFFDMGHTNHELKFGFGYRNTPVHSTSALPGPSHGFMTYSPSNLPTLCAAQGLPSNCFRATLPRDVILGYDEKYNDAYIGDTIMFRNVTVQAGLRLDQQKTTNVGQSIDANPILATALTLPCIKSLGCPNNQLNAQLPSATYGGDPQWLKWNTVAPRISATYTPGSDRRTLLRAGYNRYVSQLGSVISGVTPLAYSAFYFYGVDANNDHTVQRNELQMIRNYTGVNPGNPAVFAVTRRADYNMKVPTTDEFIVGGERELFTDFSMGLNYTYRKYNNLTWTTREKTFGKGDYYTSADYVPATTANGTPIIAGGTFSGNGHTFETSKVPVYTLSPNVPVPVYQVLTTRPNYSQKYSGFELTATKRLSHNFMLRAAGSYNDYTESCGDGARRNPTPALGQCPGGQVAPQSAGSGAFGNDFINAKWNFDLSGLYQFPWQISLGANLFARQGYPSPFRDATSGLKENVTVVLDPIGDHRFDNVYEFDLRLAKDFRFPGGLGLTIAADVFNAPNSRTILQRETNILNTSAAGVTTSAAAGYRITEMQAPRAWRLGAKITY